MADGVDTPRGYLGHTGSVTVVTHNVITSGMLPKNMGWTNEGYRDVDGVLGPEGGLYITSNFGYDQMAPLQEHAGYPHLSDYLDDTGKVFTVSPKGYAAYGLAGPGSPNTSVTTFTSGPTCDGVRYRMPTGRARAAAVPRRGLRLALLGGARQGLRHAAVPCPALPGDRRPLRRGRRAGQPGR